MSHGYTGLVSIDNLTDAVRGKVKDMPRLLHGSFAPPYILLRTINSLDVYIE